jgi:hypothetical protein
MDKLVKRVTVVQGSGNLRQSTVVYETDEDYDEDRDEDRERRTLRPLERAIRHILKVELIMVQEAYNRHVKSASHGGSDWLLEGPSNLLRAHRKALKEARKATTSMVYDDDEDDEDKRDGD